jgi:hypothetical protein
MKLPVRFSGFRSASTEIISIVIGVLLALGVNEWNEDRVHTERANEAIKNVIQEINSNITFMVIVNTNNKAVLKSLADDSAQSEENDLLEFVPGLQIQDTAWKMLHSTGVSEFIDYPTLHKIAAIYSLQEIYKTLGYQLVHTFANTRALVLAIAPEESKEFDYAPFVGDMALIEEVESALLSSYSKTLKELESR